MRRISSSLVLVAALAGCSSKDAASPGNADLSASVGVSLPDGAAGDASADLGGVDGGSLIAARPYHFIVPSGYDKNTPTPLVILLHGYSATAVEQDAYFGLSTLAQQKTFLYAYPDGTRDPSGNQFWNADDACCDLYNIPVDDVAYLNAIIDDVEAKYNVDPKRIYFVGHSNGGFMSHRMACDAPRVAAIVSLAGAVWKDPSKCKPASPVAVLEVHGDADAVINYNGGQIANVDYPSAHDTVATWAAKDGCTPSLIDTGMTLDLDSSLPGNETRVERYDGCGPGGAVELWTIQGGSHVPALQPTWAATIYGFLMAHPKP